VTHQLDRKPAPSLEHVRVADAMNAGVVTCAADAPLRDVAWLTTTDWTAPRSS
jgi:hypothetical protein